MAATTEALQLTDRCGTVHNGIEVGEFVAEKTYKKLERRKTKHVMYAGAVSPQKGIHVLLDAFKSVVRNFSDVHLNIVGPRATVPYEGCFSCEDQELFARLRPFYGQNHVVALRQRLTPPVGSMRGGRHGDGR